MRMHTHGKCSSNIVLGALTVFCVIVLYNYWAVSTLNHDLIIKVHSLEEQIISLSKSNDALQANLEKVEEIKEKVEGNLKKEQLVDQRAKEEISHKDTKIKSLQNDLENSKQETQNCRDDLTASETRIAGKVKEVSDMKAKVVSLEAQLVEKGNKVARVEKELKEVKKKLAVNGSRSSISSTAKSVPAGLKAPPGVDIAPQDAQPVLMSDPAVPYPKGWMEPHFSVRPSKVHVNVKTEGSIGIQGHGGPVLIFDHPSLPRAKTRFSVLDPPKNEMNKPDVASAGAPPLKQQDTLHKPAAHMDGGEQMDPQPMGVLPIPGQQQGHPPNLDAAEDDGDRPLKDDFGLQDDQSPDGALSPKEMNAAIQAPDLKHHENIGQQQPLPFDNNL